MKTNYTVIESPVGELLASADAAGRITGLHFLTGKEGPGSPAYGRLRHSPGGRRTPAPDSEWVRDDRALAPLRRELREYFAGERREFDVELAPAGSPFQLSVWRALRAIPYGETASYGEVAAAVGQPGAARAVGGANNRNPIAIVVPCHRVIGASGSLTGYGGGLDRKQRLLALEAGVQALGGDVSAFRGITPAGPEDGDQAGIVRGPV
jgi:methylated-DNA-[protein]-cysteine S-methyltransferase